MNSLVFGRSCNLFFLPVEVASMHHRKSTVSIYTAQINSFKILERVHCINMCIHGSFMFSKVMGIDMVLDSFACVKFSQDHARHTLHEVVRSGKSRRHYRLLNDPSEVTNSPWIIWCTPVRTLANLS